MNNIIFWAIVISVVYVVFGIFKKISRKNNTAQTPSRAEKPAYAEYKDDDNGLPYGKTRAEITELFKPYRKRAKINEVNLKAARQVYKRVVTAEMRSSVARRRVLIWSGKAGQDIKDFLDLSSAIFFETQRGVDSADKIINRLEEVANELDQIIDDIDDLNRHGEVYST